RIPLSVLLGVAFVLLKVLQFYWERKKLIKALEAFPGPPKHWLYGHNHLLKPEIFLHQVVSWGEEYPHAFPRWFGPILPSMIIHHPEYAKTILGRADPKASAFYKLLVPWIGKGLLILEGSKWFQHRKMITPAFHYDVLKSYVTLMSDSVKVMLDKWDKRITERSSVELFQDVGLMTLDSLMKCAFKGYTLNRVQADGQAAKHMRVLWRDRICCSPMRRSLKRSRRRSTWIFWTFFFVARMRMELDCLMRTCVLRWTPSCLRAMTQQPVASPGSSTACHCTLSTSSAAGRRSRASWGTETPLSGELGLPTPSS
uniref:CP4B1 protein n=1 Tax=Junco hyemalis TaxID=40217 RepID=A0A8C5IZ25_JUNHY